MDEGEGAFGISEDSSEQFHRNEAISAVSDEGFLGEEENDDYEDLYNDVNVGEGFLKSLQKEDSGFRNETVEKVGTQVSPPPTVPEPTVSIPGVGSGIGGDDGGVVAGAEIKFDGVVGNYIVARVPERLEGSQTIGLKSNEISAQGSSVAPPGAAGPPFSVGMRVELGRPSKEEIDYEEQTSNNNIGVESICQTTQVGPVGNEAFIRQGGLGIANGISGNVDSNGVVGGAIRVGGGGTILFTGDLHWWTTDAELEFELCKYGHVKEVKFFDEKASGKSKGYCQVEFYDPAATTACKEGMNGHIFNGRPCVVAYASPFSIKRMGEAQVSRHQQQTNSQSRRGTGDSTSNYQGGDNNRGRSNWGKGNTQGMVNRGAAGPMRNRSGNMGGRGLIGNGGNGFGPPQLMNPQAIMAMGRMANFGGFPTGPAPPFSGILPSFPPVGNVGLPGVAPHVNPAFFGRGMSMNGMGMMPATGVDSMGMWSDPSMAGWAGDAGHDDEAVSDHQHGDASHDKSAWPFSGKEKDKGSERDWSGSSDRRLREDKEPVSDRGISREKDTGHDHDVSQRRHRDDRDRERVRERDRGNSRDSNRERDRDRIREERDRYGDEWDRGRSSRSHSKSRLDDGRRSRSRDLEHGRRR